MSQKIPKCPCEIDIRRGLAAKLFNEPSRPSVSLWFVVGWTVMFLFRQASYTIGALVLSGAHLLSLKRLIHQYTCLSVSQKNMADAKLRIRVNDKDINYAIGGISLVVNKSLNLIICGR